MTYQIQEYNQTAAALEVLREKYSGPFDVSTSKGMSAAREARAEVRSYRVTLEKVRQEIKAPALERARLIDAEAKRITAALLKIEEPIDAAIKAEETRKAEERAAKERAEAARVAAIQARIATIRHCYTSAVNKTAAEITTTIEAMDAMTLEESDFEEFTTEAKAAQVETRAALVVLKAEQLEKEAEQARIIAEREELARLRRQDEERQATQRRIEAEAKARADAEAAEIRRVQEAEAARIAAAQRELDERQHKIDEEEKRQAQEAEAKAKAKNGRGKKVVNPLQELEGTIGAGMPLSTALKMAYDMGYEDGLKAAQRAA